MNVRTFPDDRMVYVEVVPGAVSTESGETARGIVIDYDAAGKPVGIEIDVDEVAAHHVLAKTPKT